MDASHEHLYLSSTGDRYNLISPSVPKSWCRIMSRKEFCRILSCHNKVHRQRPLTKYKMSGIHLHISLLPCHNRRLNSRVIVWNPFNRWQWPWHLTCDHKNQISLSWLNSLKVFPKTRTNGTNGQPENIMLPAMAITCTESKDIYNIF